MWIEFFVSIKSELQRWDPYLFQHLARPITILAKIFLSLHTKIDHLHLWPSYETKTREHRESLMHPRLFFHRLESKHQVRLLRHSTTLSVLVPLSSLPGLDFCSAPQFKETGCLLCGPLQFQFCGVVLILKFYLGLGWWHATEAGSDKILLGLSSW